MRTTARTSFIFMLRSVRRLASATWLLNNLRLQRKPLLVLMTASSASIPSGPRCAAIRASRKSSPPSRPSNIWGAHADRVLVSAGRRNNLSLRVQFQSVTSAPSAVSPLQQSMNPIQRGETNFPRNETPNSTEYTSERPEMTSHGGKPRKAKTRKGKLVYEKSKHHVHRKHSPNVEGPAHQVGSGAGGSCINHASFPARRSGV